MSYLAIARKYRPATFAEIVGQKHVTRTLENALRTGRIHHAFLFTGARGVGKTTAARALAKALNCEQGPTVTPCGTCTSCVEITSGSAPDLIEIDGASNNSVDDIRELRETVHYAPTLGRYKIYLIDEVHMLSKAAFNALLKTLEEPPPHVVFLFATTEPHKILDTILSRVQRFDFKRIPASTVTARLRSIADQEGVQISDISLRRIARAGEGSMRDAESLLDKVVSFGAGEDGSLDDAQVAETLGLIDRTLTFQFLQGLVQGAPDGCLDAIATVYDYGYELSQFTTDLLELLRNATFVKLSKGARRHVDLAQDELERLDTLVTDVPVEQLTRTFNALLDVHDQVSRANRPRIVLEMAVARLATTRPVQPVHALLERLEGLERRLRAGGATAPVRDRRAGGGAPKRGRAPSGAEPGGRERSARSRGRRSSGPSGPPSPPDDDSRPAAAASRAQRTPAPAARAPPTPTPQPSPEPAVGSQQRAQAQQRPQRAQAHQRPEPPPMEAHHAGVASGDRGQGSRSGGRTPSAWTQLTAHLRQLGGPAVRLAEGNSEVRGGVLTVTLPAGRALAEGRRAKGLPEVAGALRKFFPNVQNIDVVALPGSGTASDRDNALRTEVLDDPACKRLIEAMGAELDSVTSLRDD